MILNDLIANLNEIHLEIFNNVRPEKLIQGVTLFGVTGTYPTNCKTYSSVSEMYADTSVREDNIGVVYGTDYEGTYRYDNGSWTHIGDVSDGIKIMDVLNEILVTSDIYEGNGATDEELTLIFNEILGIVE